MRTASSPVRLCLGMQKMPTSHFWTALTGALRRFSPLVWLATWRSERLALHPASTTKNGTSKISASQGFPCSNGFTRSPRFLTFLTFLTFLRHAFPGVRFVPTIYPPVASFTSAALQVLAQTSAAQHHRASDVAVAQPCSKCAALSRQASAGLFQSRIDLR